jgi:broad specificity phosphatase PhoE
VLTSPQRRAQQTAAPIAAAHALAVQTEPDLSEVWVGHWQGQTYAELGADLDAARYATDATHQCAAIEDAGSVQQRVVAVLDRLATGERGRRLCLVSHGDPIRLLLVHCLGAELAAFRRLHVAPGSISVVRVGAQRREVLAVNWRPGVALPND